VKKLEDGLVHLFSVDETEFENESCKLMFKDKWVVQVLNQMIKNKPSDKILFINTHRCKLWIKEGHDKVFEEIHALLGSCDVAVYQAGGLVNSSHTKGQSEVERSQAEVEDQALVLFKCDCREVGEVRTCWNVTESYSEELFVAPVRNLSVF
jgi:hypothetical protein